jgi:hypothetical protein
MYARVNIIFGRKDKVKDGIAHLEESDRGAVEATEGNQGLTTFVDRGAGVIVAVSYWDEPSHSSEAALTRAREGAVAAADGDLVVETYEVVSQEGTAKAAPGAVVQMTRVQIEQAKITDGIEFVCDEVLPQLRGSAGFCSAEFLVDRHAGAGLVLTMWTTENDATRAETVIDRTRDEAERFGTKFPRTETYSLVGNSARD